LFTKDELLEQIKMIYSHLPPNRQAELAGALAQKDSRPPDQIGQHGTIGQHGQRIDVFEGSAYAFEDPKTIKEASLAFHDKFKILGAWHYTRNPPAQGSPDADIVQEREEATGSEVKVTISTDGRVPEPSPPRPFTMPLGDRTIPSEDALIKKA